MKSSSQIWDLTATIIENRSEPGDEYVTSVHSTWVWREDSWIRLKHSTLLPELHKEAKLRLSAWTSRTCHQAASSSLRWWQSNLEFQATSDKDFIGLKSSLEAEILVSNLPLYDLLVGETKKLAILKWTSPLRSAGLRNAISYMELLEVLSNYQDSTWGI